MKSSLNNLYITLIGLLLGSNVLAQEPSNPLDPAKAFLNEQRRLWKNQGSAAALRLDTIIRYSTLNIGHYAYSGNYRRPQQPKSGDEQSLSTWGNITLGKFYVEGGFGYSRENLRQVGFNASIIDPYRGMPYLVADTNASDWRNQHYALDFRIASPIYHNHWSLGLEGRYNASSGAKQRDIRSENYYYSLYLSPSLMYHNGRHHLGTSFIYQDTKEESSQSLVNVYVNQQYYSLLGLGHAVAALGGGGVYNYQNESRGLGLHYEYSGPIRALFSGSYRWEAEDVNSSYSNPMPVGTVSRKILSVNTAFLKENDTQLHRLDANFWSREMKGIEYVVKRVNQENQNYWDILSKDVRSTYKARSAEVNYTFLKKSKIGYDWKFNVGLQYQQTDDRYNIPGSYRKTETLLYQLTAARQLRLSPRLAQVLMLGLEASYRHNIAADYVYKGNFPEYPIVNQLEMGDIAWFQANVLALQVPIRYSRRIKEKAKPYVYIQTEGNLIMPSGSFYQDRTAYRLTLGLNF
ncbi:DUF6850 family outer membrane beta-barrel protein [Sphingobacterium sp. BIGb0165]|uniref:DUF6850 family outer membrane beta-barrel protein n=1 Tax=Sphingobacterium sp. BIGb0165 TaxID=2940615 RepID=UPI0021671C78|nr:DUF6850 family outer membrane beta-barrel protein [Sphingobacterium sp. BIGb0165]MCS4226478.1 hypothetical protein [Sphingobacterium sp. BIGb0165]